MSTRSGRRHLRNLTALRNALRGNDAQAITAAAEGLQDDYDRVVQIRGRPAQVQEIESRQQPMDDQNVATQSLLSSIEDTDFTEAIGRFQTLQTTLQASLQTSAPGTESVAAGFSRLVARDLLYG